MCVLRCQVKIQKKLEVNLGRWVFTSMLFMGCAQYQNVGVVSEPAGAEVFLDGERVGITPMRLPIGRDRPHLLFLKLDGHIPREAVLSHNPATDGIDFLTPADVSVRLVRRPLKPGEAETGDRDRQVDVEVEE